MPRPTSRGYGLLGLAVGTYLAGRVVGTWELYLIAFALLLTFALSWLLAAVSGRHIRVTRSLAPERPVAGDEPEFTFRVENPSLLPSLQLSLHAPLAGLTAADLRVEVENLVPHGEKVLEVHVPGGANRGVHVLPPVRATADDPLGLFRVVRKVSESLAVTVTPRIAYLDSCALYPDMGLRQEWSGSRGLRSAGVSEFKGIRPHQPGEPLSHIDWKSTAKTGVLMLREMEDPGSAGVTVLLDGTARQLVGEPPNSNYELAVRAAGTIADFLLRSGRGVTLISHERRLREVRLPADGGGRRALLQALAEAQPTAPVPLVTTLHDLRTGAAHLLRTESLTVVSLSLERQLSRALIQLKESGGHVTFLYVSGISFAEGAPDEVSTLLPFLPPRERGRANDGAAVAEVAPTGLSPLSTEDQALLLLLSSAGIPCLTISRGDSLEKRLSLGPATKRSRITSR